MTMLELHYEMLDTRPEAYLLFLQRYSPSAKIVYGFCEGQTDPSFYTTFIQTLLPKGWSIDLRPLKGQKSVFCLYNAFDWKRFSKERIAFFVDRDLSEFVGDVTIPHESNIFVTEGYSTENYIVTTSTFERVLRELYNISAKDDEFSTLNDLFERQYEKFLLFMVPIMASIILWKKNCEVHHLGNVQLKKFFTFSNGIICLNSQYKQKKVLINAVKQQCRVVSQNRRGIRAIETILMKNYKYRRFIRGKYAIWFFVTFCNHIYENSTALCPSISKLPKRHLQLSESNAVLILGTRCKMPTILRTFVESVFIRYARNHPK